MVFYESPIRSFKQLRHIGWDDEAAANLAGHRAERSLTHESDPYLMRRSRAAPGGLRRTDQLAKAPARRVTP